MRLMPIYAVLSAVMLCLTVVPYDHQAFSQPPTLEQGAYVQHTDANNTTGWLAGASGANYERITGAIPLENGSMVVAGTFEQSIEFYGDVVGYSSSDSAFGIDFFIAWIDENGTWTNTLSGSSEYLDGIAAMDVLNDGTIIVAGSFCDMSFSTTCNLTLGSLDPLYKSSDEDENAVFVAALTEEGDWLWAKSFSNAYQMSVVDLMVTPSNEIHLGLLHRGEFIVENNTSPGTDSEESMVLLGLNGNGEYLFLHTVFSTVALDDNGHLCHDASGQTYFALNIFETTIFGDIELTSTGGSNIAISHYNLDGWVWATAAGGSGDSTVKACAPHPNGGIGVVGDYLQNMTFGDWELPDSVWVDVFEAQVSSTGTWVHAAAFGGNGADHAAGLLISDQGDWIVTGHTTGSMTLGEFTLTDRDGINDGNHHDIFLAQHQGDGTWDWALSAGGNGDEMANGLILSTSGSPVVSFITNADGAYASHTFDQRQQYDMGLWLYETDVDMDGVLDGADNCPKIANGDQSNLDGDAYGNACDDDTDGDGVNNEVDDCPTGEVGWVANAESDHDSDGCRDLNEDLDDDEDGIFDSSDLCPKGPIGWISTDENDIERDGCSDQDNDGDGFVDQADNCPSEANPTQADLDNDGFGDACDADKDGDGVSVPDDNCPNDIVAWVSFSWNDYDRDGCRDETTDDDDDDDGVLDVNDDCLLGEKNWIDQDPAAVDHDSDGCLDATEDEDDDNDDKKDPIDRCPRGLVGVAQPGQDLDGDGCIDAVEDDDDDQDGVLDPLDDCPNSDPADKISAKGCSQFQLDDDKDGVFNAFDFCLNTPFGSSVDEQGCAAETNAQSGETDSDGFGLAGWLLLLAGGMIAWAIYTNNQRPGPPLPRVNPVKVSPTIPENSEE